MGLYNITFREKDTYFVLVCEGARLKEFETTELNQTTRNFHKCQRKKFFGLS